MLATDQKQTVLAGVSETAQVASVYSAYGYREEESATHGLIGFNGEVREEGSSWYLLGNGHRVYNPTLMKFHSPDDYGPYGEAGFNLYAYCLGDPVNYVDPTGNVAWLAIPRAIWGGLKSLFGLGKSASKGGRTFRGTGARSGGVTVTRRTPPSNSNATVTGNRQVPASPDVTFEMKEAYRRFGFEYRNIPKRTVENHAGVSSELPARPRSVVGPSKGQPADAKSGANVVVKKKAPRKPMTRAEQIDRENKARELNAARREADKLRKETDGFEGLKGRKSGKKGFNLLLS